MFSMPSWNMFAMPSWDDVAAWVDENEPPAASWVFRQRSEMNAAMSSLHDARSRMGGTALARADRVERAARELAAPVVRFMATGAVGHGVAAAPAAAAAGAGALAATVAGIGAYLYIVRPQWRAAIDEAGAIVAEVEACERMARSGVTPPEGMCNFEAPSQVGGATVAVIALASAALLLR